jgi:hypothetical protein
MAKRNGQAKQKQKANSICFDYIKSNFFRVIRVDGVNGSPTPRGDGIQMALFSERMPIPKTEEFAVDNGKLGKRISVDGRTGVVREVEVEAIISISNAKALCTWLQGKIKTAEELAARGASNVK